MDELEMIIRAMDLLECKVAMRSRFNQVVPALGGRPIDACRTAKGRRAVLQQLERISPSSSVGEAKLVFLGVD
jgi:hypothetical protein